jgi:hypothetical protein
MVIMLIVFGSAGLGGGGGRGRDTYHDIRVTFFKKGSGLHLHRTIINVDTRRLESAAMHSSTGYSISSTRDYISDHLLHSILEES